MSFMQFGQSLAPSDLTAQDKIDGFNAVIRVLHDELLSVGADPQSLSEIGKKLDSDLGDNAKWFADQIISKLGE